MVKNTDIIEYYVDLLCKISDSNYNSINIIIKMYHMFQVVTINLLVELKSVIMTL